MKDLRRALADNTNKGNRCTGTYEDEALSSDTAQGPSLEAEIAVAGRQIAAMRFPFFLDEKGRSTKKVKFDAAFNTSERFNSRAEKIQGQLHDIVGLLPEEAKDAVHNRKTIPSWMFYTVCISHDLFFASRELKLLL